MSPFENYLSVAALIAGILGISYGLYKLWDWWTSR
jgi:hypothetical protein